MAMAIFKEPTGKGTVNKSNVHSQYRGRSGPDSSSHRSRPELETERRMLEILFQVAAIRFTQG
jgi:hypothetical protein